VAAGQQLAKAGSSASVDMDADAELVAAMDTAALFAFAGEL
jgi:hypothetical protein